MGGGQTALLLLPALSLGALMDAQALDLQYLPCGWQGLEDSGQPLPPSQAHWQRAGAKWSNQDFSAAPEYAGTVGGTFPGMSQPHGSWLWTLTLNP